MAPGGSVRSLSILISTFAGAALLIASPAAAATFAAINIEAGPLGRALAELARESSVEVLFSEDMVGGHNVGPLKGRMAPADALGRLLTGTGLGYRTTSDGVFVIAPHPAAVAPDDGAIAEVLVVGRRTQNTDIRRTENDIQPYRIIGQKELASALQETVDQVLRSRISANAPGIAPTQWVPNGAYTNSAVDLRGVGVQRTLVLVDGRRLPSLPTIAAGLNQADLNALPLGAIDRIETLTATAGGIHGFSAIGGAVNVVLRRDYRGAELTAASGVTSRGDARWGRIEARIGFTPDDGQTDVMLAGAYSRHNPISIEDRDFGRASLELIGANAPLLFAQRGYVAGGILIRSSTGRPLQLDPALGGGSLGSPLTYLPLDFVGDAAARSEVLIANSGSLPARVAPGRAGEDASLIAGSETRSVIVNVRRPITDDLELYLDGLYLRNDGRTVTPAINTGGFAPANAATNPFTEGVLFSFPIAGFAADNTVRLDTTRLSAGVIASLPRKWQAAIDVTLGEADLHAFTQRRLGGTPLSMAIQSGNPGAGDLPKVDPLGDFAALQSAIDAYSFDTWSDLRLRTEFSAASLRFAGPLAQLAGGPLTVTLLGDYRRERMPERTSPGLNERGVSTSVYPNRVQTVGSAYAELRAPLIAKDAAFAPARGLELQLALRRDELKTTFPENILSGALELGDTTISHTTEVFTAGGRVFPAPWLLLRAGVATGEAPPDLRHLQQRGLLTATLLDPIGDPRRNGRQITLDGPYFWVRNGFHGVKPETGRTVSVGVVFNPSGRAGPRLSIDYARVDVRDEIIDLRMGIEQVLAQESRLPDRVVRESLSPADAALGYSAGRILEVHTGMINGGRLTTETVDFQLDWPLPSTSLGDFRLYGGATWQPTYRRQARLDGPIVDSAGLQDTPLKWRGAGGLEWTRGPLTANLELQYFGDHSLRYSPSSVVLIGADRVLYNGTERIPSQTYVDLSARRRFELAAGLPARSLEIRLGVQNLFDRLPPVVADPTNMGYDYYGDPRGRRFEVQISATF